MNRFAEIFWPVNYLKLIRKCTINVDVIPFSVSSLTRIWVGIAVPVAIVIAINYLRKSL